MSHAIKCDRCGIFVDPESDFKGERCKFRTPAFKNSEDSKNGRVTHYLTSNIPPDGYLDLCPKCAFDFMLFMNGCKLEKKEYKDSNKHDTSDALLEKMRSLAENIWRGDKTI